MLVSIHVFSPNLKVSQAAHKTLLWNILKIHTPNIDWNNNIIIYVILLSSPHGVYRVRLVDVWQNEDSPVTVKWKDDMSMIL